MTPNRLPLMQFYSKHLKNVQDRSGGGGRYEVLNKRIKHTTFQLYRTVVATQLQSGRFHRLIDVNVASHASG